MVRNPHSVIAVVVLSSLLIYFFPAHASLPDEETIQRAISSSRMQIMKAMADMAYEKDAIRKEQLKNKLAVLKNQISLGERLLHQSQNSLKAGDWMRMTDSEREKYVDDAGLPPEYADRFTLYIMEHPDDINLPLEKISAHQSRRMPKGQRRG